MRSSKIIALKKWLRTQVVPDPEQVKTRVDMNPGCDGSHPGVVLQDSPPLCYEQTDCPHWASPNPPADGFATPAAPRQPFGLAEVTTRHPRYGFAYWAKDGQN